jgi:hypothetical protein
MNKILAKKESCRCSLLLIFQPSCSVRFSCILFSIVASIVIENLLYIRWLKNKKEMDITDNLINTGLWKGMSFEILLCGVMNYPSLYGSTYLEEANIFSAGKVFRLNDFLLFLMIFVRVKFFVKPIIEISYYTDPRAQRVC